MFDTVDELLKKIRMGEDSFIEVKDLRYKGNKVSEPHSNSIADELASAANSGHCVFVFGVDNKTRLIMGIPMDKLDVVEIWIRGICSDLIKPQLFYRLEKLTVIAEDGLEKYLIRIDVPKSMFIHQSPGGYYERIGTEKRSMAPDRLARLFQQRSQARMIYFDEQSVSIAPKNVLVKKLWEKFTTSNSPENDEEFLYKLRFLTKDDDGKICPTVSGILMASENPCEYMPSAFIQAVAYRSDERNAAYQLDSQDITGPLDKQIKDACTFVNKNMRIYAVKEPYRRDIPQYSMQAVFEAVVNAVAHRDYSIAGSKIRLHLFSDRLELFSPGSISNTLTIESMAYRQVTRNELLTSMLSRCSVETLNIESSRQYLIERRGEGIPIIMNESEKLSGRRPEYVLLDEAELLLTIYAASLPN